MTIQLNDWINQGLMVLNDRPPDTVGDHRNGVTVIATGVARGGTTMLAQMLDGLGLFTGDVRDSSDLSDLAILGALQKSDTARLREIISRRNQRFPTWGFKVPNLHHFLPVSAEQWFRDPRYIVVLRDPVAIARRNEMSVNQGAVEALRLAGENIMKLTSYACALTAPVLLVSYEKAIQNADLVVQAICSFCGLTPTDGQRAVALSAIIPNDAAYIYAQEYATQGVFRGQIDRVLGNVLRGWCCYRHSTDIVEIEVFADDRLIGSFRSETYRGDLARAGIHLGNHAFEIDLAPFEVLPSSLISVRPEGYTRALPNSGKSVEALQKAG